MRLTSKPNLHPFPALLLTLALVACGNTPSPAVSPSKPSAPAPANAQPPQQAPAAATAKAPATPAPVAVNTAKAVAKPIVIELSHDVVCPWCRIGHAYLDQAVAKYGGPVEIVYRPFLLDPNSPAEPRNLKASLEAKYGPGIEKKFARVTQTGAKAGLKFTFNDKTRSFQSIKAHALLDWAPQPKRGAILDALHTAYFERNDDISSTELLAKIAAGVGLDPAGAKIAVTDTARLARVHAQATGQRGIRGVPHFQIGNQPPIRGAQPPKVLLQALAAAAAATAPTGEPR